MAERKMFKQLRMPRWLCDEITKYAKAEGSNFSQFMRTAAVERIKRMKKAA